MRGGFVNTGIGREEQSYDVRCEQDSELGVAGSLGAAMAHETPLQLPGVVNAYAAITAQRLGFNAVYLSGSGVATASFGLPDLGITSLSDVLEDVRRITSVCDLPTLVDCDTGWGAAPSIARTVQQMERAGAAAIHIEDQVQNKRCGHLEGKQVVEPAEMCDRLSFASDARSCDEFMIIARTDALALEGLDSTLARSAAYVAAGADAIFAEAVTRLEHYREFADACDVPILANITEFGKTPLWTVDELRDAGVSLVIYALSAFRAMAKAAESVYCEIRERGTQRGMLGAMEPRDDLYRHIGYADAQARIDAVLQRESRAQPTVEEA